MKQRIFLIAAALSANSLAMASNLPLMTLLPPSFHPVVALQGGYASLNANNNTQRFMTSNGEIFIYNNSNDSNGTGFAGAFLGFEHTMPWQGIFMQTGVEYNYFGGITIDGTNSVGAESQTSTAYNYQYDFQTQQVLGVFRLFATNYGRIHPYAEAGLGAAFNRSGSYSASTKATGSINLTPVFSTQTNTEFSYGLGLGVETEVNTNTRLGFGYRYSNFGSSSLKNGKVTINHYQSPVPFALSNSNYYANQFFVRISYVS